MGEKVHSRGKSPDQQLSPKDITKWKTPGDTDSCIVGLEAATLKKAAQLTGQVPLLQVEDAMGQVHIPKLRSARIGRRELEQPAVP